MANTPISSVDTPDPWIISHNSLFYLTFTLGSRIEIWSSSDLESFHHAQKSLIWAPELHFLSGAWYIYFAAERPSQGNASHRTLILRSYHSDPMNREHWEFLGPLQGVPDHWAIDATILSLNQELYCCYSGWLLGDHSDTEQVLYLIKLENPEKAVEETLTLISKPTLP